MSVNEIVYNNRENTNDLLLMADGVAVDLSSVTRMQIIERNEAFTVDSQTASDAFDWSRATTGKVVLSLGGEGLNPGTYACRLITYDPSNPDGIVWGDDYLTLMVR